VGRKKQRGWDRVDAILLAIVAAGLLWRVGYVVAQRDDPLTGDGVGYHQQSVLLSDGHGFISTEAYVFAVAGHVGHPREVPTADHPPAWALVMAPLALVGLRGVLAHQLFACVVGSLTVAMVGLTGRRIFGPVVGLTAAGIAAAYPNLWMYERLLLSETLTFLMVAVLCFVAYGFLAEPTRRGAVALGVTTAALVLTRAEAAERYELPYEREADLVVTGDRNTVIGAREAEHDLSALAGHRLRSHGGAYEQTVPLLLSHRLTEDYSLLAQSQRLRNFAVFEFALNGAIA